MSFTRRYIATPIDILNPRRPIDNAAIVINRILGVLGSIAIALVGWGVLSAVQGDALEGLWGALLGVVNAAATFATSLHIRGAAEPLVTPLSDPRDNDMRPLVAVAPGSRLVTREDRQDQGPATSGRPTDTTRPTRPVADLSYPTRRRDIDDRPDRRRADNTNSDLFDPFTPGGVAGIYNTNQAFTAEPPPAYGCPTPAPDSSTPADGGGCCSGGGSSDGGGCGGGE